MDLTQALSVFLLVLHHCNDPGHVLAAKERPLPSSVVHFRSCIPCGACCIADIHCLNDNHTYYPPVLIVQLARDLNAKAPKLMLEDKIK